MTGGNKQFKGVDLQTFWEKRERGKTWWAYSESDPQPWLHNGIVCKAKKKSSVWLHRTPIELDSLGLTWVLLFV